MNLALTYASRTHHLRLARQISELIQLKSLTTDQNSDEDNEDYLLDNNVEEDAALKDREYARDRSEKLKRSVRPPSTTVKKGLISSRKMGFSKRSTTGSEYKRESISASSNDKEDGLEVNETKELFSDNAQSDTEMDAAVERTGSDAESVGYSPTHVAPFITPGSERRLNPFKVRDIYCGVQEL